MTLPRMIEREPKAGVAPRPRSPGHLRWVSKHACCVTGCSGRPIHAHHVLLGNMAKSLKPSDGRTLSLCLAHHEEAHRGEERFQAKYGVDLLARAAEFASKSKFRRKLGVT